MLIHSLLADTLAKWEENTRYEKAEDWVVTSRLHSGNPVGDRLFRANAVDRPQNVSTFALAGIRSGIRTPRFAKCWNGIQGDARTSQTLVYTIHVGHLYASRNTGKRAAQAVVCHCFSSRSGSINMELNRRHWANTFATQ